MILQHSGLPGSHRKHLPSGKRGSGAQTVSVGRSDVKEAMLLEVGDDRLGVPYLTTLHGRLDLRGLKEAIRCFPRAPFVSISDDQRKPLPEANWLGTVYHGMPANLYEASYAPG